MNDPKHDELMRQFEVVVRNMLIEKRSVNSLVIYKLNCEEKLDVVKVGAREFCLSTEDSLMCYMRAQAAIKRVNELARIRALDEKPITSDNMVNSPEIVASLAQQWQRIA